MSTNGATGRDPVKSTTKKTKLSSQVQVNPASATNGHHRLGNGDTEHSTASEASSTGPSSTTTSINGASRHPPCLNGHSHVYKAQETSPVIKKLYYNLLSLAGVDREVIKVFNVSEHSLKRLTNHQLVCKIIDLSTEYIKTSERSFESFIDEFRSIGLEVTFTTMYTEFRSVVTSLFNDGINFGRVLSFLRFSAAYAVFVYRQGMKKAVPSVEAWTVEVIERDLGTFFTENRGWVSRKGYVHGLTVCAAVHYVAISCCTPCTAISCCTPCTLLYSYKLLYTM